MPQNIDKLLRNIERHVKAGETALAAEGYRHILSRFPKNKRARQGYENLSKPPQVDLDNLISFFSKGQFKKTVAFGEQLVEKFPTAPILYEVLAAACMSLENNKPAIKYYTKLLEINPKHTDAHNNLGMMYYKLGNFEYSIESYKKAVKAEPKFADAHYNLGNAYRKADKLNQAIESYTTSLEINPDDIEVQINLGEILWEYGAFDEAVDCYSKLLEISPKKTGIQEKITGILDQKNEVDRIINDYQINTDQDPKTAETLIFKGGIYEGIGCFELALKIYKQALKINPENAQAHYNIGKILNFRDDLAPAIKHLEQAIRIDPERADIHYLLSDTWKKNEKIEAAIEECKIVIGLEPDFAEAYNLLGYLKRKQGNFDAAIEHCEQAIKIKPAFYDAFNNLGITYFKIGDLNAATRNQKKAIELHPELAHYHLNLGYILAASFKFDLAIKSFKKAIEIDPENQLAHWNEALSYLTKEDFQNGWNSYHYRWTALPDMANRYLQTSKPMWKPNKRERVLLWAEQGIGDEVMFGSIIMDLHALCSKLIITIDERLIPIFERSLPDDIDFRSKDIAIPEEEYDSHLPLGDLPLFFRKNIKDFKPASTSWLYENSEQSNRLRRKLNEDGTKTLVGISWHSSRERPGTMHKVISLSKLAKKLHGPKIKLINLQYGDVSQEIDSLKNNTGIEIIRIPEIDNKNDINGLVDLIMACDRIVSISNVTVHLAGALGKKTDMLLPFSADWRWGSRTDTTHWYASLRLNRQAKSYDWDTVLEKL